MSDFKTLTIAETAENLKKWAENGLSMLIISHRSPDGDTLGSAFAMKLIYEAMGGKAQCTCKSEGAQFLRFIYAGQDEITYTEGLEKEFDKVISIDVASVYQLGGIIADTDIIDMQIDHHELGEKYADNLIDGERSAAGELVYEIYEYLQKNGVIGEIPEAAMRMYAALSADTGSFKFSNTSGRTHEIAGKLVCEMKKAGIEHAQVGRILHDSFSLETLKARKMAIENLKTRQNGKLAYVVITNKCLEENGLTEESTGAIVDIPRSLETSLVGFALKQQSENEGEFRIQSRSNCDIDVAEICAKFGGGGHRKAAGGRVRANSADEAEKIVADVFEQYVKAYTEENK